MSRILKIKEMKKVKNEVTAKLISDRAIASNDDLAVNCLCLSSKVVSRSAKEQNILFIFFCLLIATFAERHLK